MDENELQERKVFLTQMETHFDRQELTTILGLARERLQRIPGDLDARIVTCRVWLLQGRLDEARDMLLEIEEIIASLSQVYVCMGDICMKKGMEDSAEAFYRKFLVLNPKTPLVGDVTERIQQIEERQEAGADADAEPETEVPADFQTVTLAELYIRQGHLRSAEEILEKIVGGDPLNAKAAGLLSKVREQLHRDTAAQPYVEIIAELSRWLENIDRLRSHAA